MAQKMYGTILKTYMIVVSYFSMINKDNRVNFVGKSFLLANVKSDIVRGILFLIRSNVKIDSKAGNLQ